MAAYSAVIKGASKVMVVDRHPDRLKKAEEIGAIPIDDSAVDPVEAVNEMTMGLGADNGCECVGYQAHDPEGHEHPNMTLNRLVKSVRFTGDIGVVGVFIPQDPGGPDELAKRGAVAFDFGEFWFRGQKLGTGQCPVKRYNRRRSATSSPAARRSRPGSSAMSFRWTRRPRATSTSTTVTRAGPRSSCTRLVHQRGGEVVRRHLLAGRRQ